MVHGAASSNGSPAEVMRAEAMAAYTRSILEPLVTRLAEQEAIIRDQAETVGSLRAQLAAAEEWIHALEDLQRPLAPDLGAQAPDPPSEPSEPPSAPTPAPVSSSPNASSWWQRVVAWLMVAGDHRVT